MAAEVNVTIKKTLNTSFIGKVTRMIANSKSYVAKPLQ